VELKKFAKRSSEKPVNEMSKAELWALYLEYADNSEYKSLIMEIIKGREEFQVATNALNNISTDENLLAMYRSRKKSEMLHEHNMAVAKSEGIAEGIIQTAKNALKLMLPIEQIKILTGLPEEEIEKLK
jgi:predicted transposase/invertase (TIGR01784 family)